MRLLDSSAAPSLRSVALWIAVLVVVLNPLHAAAATAPTALDQGFRAMYNLQFDAAHRAFGDWKRLAPNDPMGPVSDATAYLFSEFERLHILESEFFVSNNSFLSRGQRVPDPAVKARFEEALGAGKQLADAKLAKSPDDPNAQFANVLRFGLEADYQALIEKRYLASLDNVKSGRTLAQKLLAVHPEYSDAYLAIGVENYLLSQKNAALRWMLRINGAQTDKTEGVKNLRLTAEKGHYLKPYARLLLAVVALRDKDKSGAADILRSLAREFPKNPLYSQEAAKLSGAASR